MKLIWRFGIVIAALLIFSALVFYLGLVREFVVALIVPALALIGAGVVAARSRRRRKLSETEKRENQPSSVGGAQQGVATKKSSGLGGIAAGVACLVVAIVVAYHIYHYDKLAEARYVATIGNRCPVARAKVWQPERFELNKPGEWVPTVPNVDTVTWKPASYKLWANKPYRVMSTDPETGKRLEGKMPMTPMYWYGARADFGIGHLWMAAIDSNTVVMVQRVM